MRGEDSWSKMVKFIGILGGGGSGMWSAVGMRVYRGSE